ncbi:hypothetical protein [Clostridium butyricum]|mgnify:CR=1 FL=1
MSLCEKILCWMGISTKKDTKELACKIEELFKEQQVFLNAYKKESNSCIDVIIRENQNIISRMNKIEQIINNLSDSSLKEINSIEAVNELVIKSSYTNEQKIQELKDNIFDVNTRIDKFSKSNNTLIKKCIEKIRENTDNTVKEHIDGLRNKEFNDINEKISCLEEGFRLSIVNSLLNDI